MYLNLGVERKTESCRTDLCDYVIAQLENGKTSQKYRGG